MAAKYWLLFLICCQTDKREEVFVLAYSQSQGFMIILRPLTGGTQDNWIIAHTPAVHISVCTSEEANVPAVGHYELSHLEHHTLDIYAEGIDLACYFLFTLFNTPSLSDLSGTLGGILGGQLRAVASDERGGRGGGAPISDMSFGKPTPLILAIQHIHLW